MSHKSLLARMNVMRFALCALSGLFGVHVQAAMEATTAADGKNWADASAWSGGEAPDGQGAILNIGGAHWFGNSSSYNDSGRWFNASPTLGVIRRTAEAGPFATDKTAFYMPGVNISDGEQPNPVEPTMAHNEGANDFPAENGQPRDFGVVTNALTLDNGAQPARIEYLVPTASATTRNQILVDVPIRLKSDLTLTHNGYNNGVVADSSNNSDMLYAAIEIGGDISSVDGAKHDITVNNPIYANSKGVSQYNATMLNGDNSGWVGDAIVQAGVLRLAGKDGYRGIIPQLGSSGNNVYATTGDGAVDLMGGIVDSGHHLYIGGTPALATMGVLHSSDRDPLAIADWQGPVTVQSATTVGGYASAVGAGDLRISGPIDGSASITVVGNRRVEFTGDNGEFTGDFILNDGGARTRFGADASFGAGEVVMKGGVIEMCAADDGDVSSLGSRLDTTSNSKPLNLDLNGDFTYEPASGFVNLYGFAKCGKGTLRLSHDNTYASKAANGNPKNYVEEGELVLDYSKGATSLLGNGKNSSNAYGILYLSNDARLTVAGTDESWTGGGLGRISVVEGSLARATLEGKGQYSLGSTFVFTAGVNTFKSGILLLDKTDGAGDWTTTASVSGTTGILSPNVIWKETTFAVKDGSVVAGLPDSSYATDFTSVSVGANAVENSLVDVTAAIGGDGNPVSFTNGALRFNTPNGGTPVVLDMTGFTNRLTQGTILITPNMGTTPVVIKGGALTGTAGDSIRIVNLNTNATLTLACDFVGGTWAPGAAPANTQALSILGPGRTIFTGTNHCYGRLYLVGANIEIADKGLFAEFDTRENDNTLRREPRFSAGTIVHVTESMSVAGTVSVNGKLNRPDFCFGRGKNGFEIAAGKTLTWGSTAYPYIQDGGVLLLSGSGQFKALSNVNLIRSNAFGMKIFPVFGVSRYAVEGCSLTGVIKNTLTAPFLADLSGGARCVDASYVMGLNGGRYRAACDYNRANRFRVAKGETAVFDLYSTGEVGVLNNNHGGCRPYKEPKGSGPFAGAGTVVLTNSLSTTAKFVPFGFHNAGLTGKLELCVPVGQGGSTWGSSLGMKFDDGEVHIPSGGSVYLSDLFGDFHAARFGGLSGTGSFSTGIMSTSEAGTVYVGCDDPTLVTEFSGYMKLGNQSHLIKVGKSAQKFSNTNNEAVAGTVAVRDGKLLVGHNDALIKNLDFTRFLNVEIPALQHSLAHPRKASLSSVLIVSHC